MLHFKFSALFTHTYAALVLSQSVPAIIQAGVGISGRYTGRYRPQIHFSAPQGFINDPNGLFLDSTGIYHIYYQYNPTQTIAGNQHWGHATSTDLLTWTNQAIAIAPSNSSEGIFSGSAVIDSNNTSGLFPNQTNGVLAYYTTNGPFQQTQDLAYSFDGGYTFTKWRGNPLIEIGSKQFRDPKVFRYRDEHWVMVIAYAVEFSIGIFTSTNGLDWTVASNFSHHGLLGAQYECPNLVQMPSRGTSETNMWLMYISINPGAPLGGSIGQYFIGSFNGTHFETVDAVARIADWGKDNYAAQFFSNIPGNQNQISIAWSNNSIRLTDAASSNWQYTNYPPTGPNEQWASTMSLARTNYLHQSNRIGYVLASLPYNLDQMRSAEPVGSNTSLSSNGILNAEIESGSAFLIDLNVTRLNTTGLANTASINFTISSSTSKENIKSGVFLAGDATQWLDRGGVHGFDNVYYTDKFSTALVLSDTFDMQVVVDRSIVEVFSMTGERSGTFVYYLAGGFMDRVSIQSSGLNQDVVISARVVPLKSTWGSGVVMPNATSVRYDSVGSS